MQWDCIAWKLTSYGIDCLLTYSHVNSYTYKHAHANINRNIHILKYPVFIHIPKYKATHMYTYKHMNTHKYALEHIYTYRNINTHT